MKLNNKGLSLVEVVIYMVISIVVIGYIFNTLSNITQTFHQEKKKSNLQMTGQDAIGMLARDLAATGYKHILDTLHLGDSIIYRRRVFKGTTLRDVLNEFPKGEAHPEYDASFLIYTSTYLDDIEVFKAKMKDAHRLDSVQRITYLTDTAGGLKRENRSYMVFLEDFDFDADTSNKYEVCHYPEAGGKEHTIEIPRSSVPIHIHHHEDYLGGCRDEYIGPSDVDENKWDHDPDNDLFLLKNVTALKYNFSEDFVNWENIPTNPNMINYIRIKLLIRSEEEGNVINRPTFDLGIGEDELPLTFTPPEGNKYFYRLYERTVEVPSNGRL